jgi:peptidoglycan endopeptidase LytE
MVLFSFLIISQEGFADVQHKVRQGDTLGKISKKYGVTVQALKEANNLPGSALKRNQVLIIPKTQNKKKTISSPKPEPVKKQTYVVRKGDNLFAIAKKTGHSVDEIKRLNHLNRNKLKTGQRLVLLTPVVEREEVVIKTDTQPSQATKVAKTSGEDEEYDPLDDELDQGGTDADVGNVEDIKNASSAPIGKWSSRDEQKLFVRVAMGFLGTPYRLGGQSVRGLDCSAFVRKIYEFFEVRLPRTAREQAYVGMRVPREELQAGDLVFFNTRRAFGHVGIYIGKNEFVHASYKQKQVRVDKLTGYYDRRFVKAVRLKKFDEGV